jgi:hypothetical protein
MSNKPEALFDKRIIHRSLRKGKVTKKEYDQLLNGLEDASKKAVPLFDDARLESKRAS